MVWRSPITQRVRLTTSHWRRLMATVSFEKFWPVSADHRHTITGDGVDDIEEPVRGSTMLYTSGTTGRPKGVYRRQPPVQRSNRADIANRGMFE